MLFTNGILFYIPASNVWLNQYLSILSNSGFFFCVLAIMIGI